MVASGEVHTERLARPHVGVPAPRRFTPLLVPLGLATLLACASNGIGARCSAATPCAMPLVCARTDDADRQLCMRPCAPDPTTGVLPRLCSDGAACVELDGADVCYLGGTRGYGTSCELACEPGQPCEAVLFCEPGTRCAPDSTLCEQACTVGIDAPCRETEVCTDVGGVGFCRPRP